MVLGIIYPQQKILYQILNYFALNIDYLSMTKTLKLLYILDETSIKEILVTDSVASKEQHPKNIAFLTASDLIADAIHRIQEHRPLSPLFKFTNPEKEN